MAQELNKARMQATRLLIGLALALGFLTAPALAEGSWPWLACKLAGYVLLVICAVGRIYSTAFIGGVKNVQLVTAGPYSMCRNPLYFYSLLGAAGVGLASGHLALLALTLGGFLFVYDRLIRREEAFLAEKFGAAFTAYQAAVPRLVPDISKYAAPAELLFQPRFLNKAVWDAAWWFAPLPWFALGDLLRQAGVLKPLFTLW